MKRWKPPRDVSKKETVGRRAFGSRVFETRENVPLHYKLNVFQDDRMGTGLSVDRLGVRGPQESVLKFISPLCEEMAGKKGTKFKGWAQLRVCDLQVAVQATRAEGEENPYHAEIDRTSYPNVHAMRSLAFELCAHASKYPFVEKPVDTSDATSCTERVCI